jgi:hypothetical protein
MLTRPSSGRRLAGRAIVALTAVAALPLTASRATEYVDVPAPQNASRPPPAAANHAAAISAALASATSAGPDLRAYRCRFRLVL